MGCLDPCPGDNAGESETDAAPSASSLTETTDSAVGNKSSVERHQRQLKTAGRSRLAGESLGTNRGTPRMEAVVRPSRERHEMNEASSLRASRLQHRGGWSNAVAYVVRLLQGPSTHTRAT